MNAANAEVYYAILGDFDPGFLLEGVVRHCQESGSKFFPSAPELAAFVRGAEPNEGEAAIIRAVRVHQRREEHKRQMMASFLAAMKKQKRVFARTHYNDDDPWRDTWKWVPKAELERRQIRHADGVFTPGVLLDQWRGDELDPPIRHALVNSLVASSTKEPNLLLNRDFAEGPLPGAVGDAGDSE